MRSQFITAERKRWSVARYNNNNAWLYNGNNGNMNNNNLYNQLSVRALAYDIRGDGLLEFRDFLAEIYGAYIITRKSKRNKASQIEFELNMAANLMLLAISVWDRDYIPAESICFMLLHPRMREVLAAWFGDRVVQTWYCIKLDPYLEGFYDERSYACRKGKGGLQAVLDFRELIRIETKDFVDDDNVYLVSRDIQACFMTVDTEILENLMVDFIEQNFGEDWVLREIMRWITRIIYRSLPQEHCRIKTHPLAWKDFPTSKSSFGKTIGIAIGNRSSQQAVLFLTTFLLMKLRERGYNSFVHYTDDTELIIHDKRKWRIDEVEMEKEIKHELHWTWHPKKKYIQHCSKGLNMLGYRLRGDRILPSKRIVHNFLWIIERFSKRAEGEMRFVYKSKDHLMQVVNSYTGLMKHCDAYRIRKKGMDVLRASNFKMVYDFHDCDKITIKKKCAFRTKCYNSNIKRKHGYLLLYNELFEINKYFQQ